MKKASIIKTLLISWALLLVITACSQIPPGSGTISSGVNSMESQSLLTLDTGIYDDVGSGTDETQVLKKLSNNADYKTAINGVYSINILDEWYYQCASEYLSSQCAYPIGLLDKKMPIELIRQIDENNYYVIYKTETGGLLYVFFEKIEGHVILKSSVYSEKTLQKSDFDSIKPGDSLQDVIKIDPTARFVKTLGKLDETYSKHLLKDGFLQIVYKVKDGKFIVKNMIYSQDFHADIYDSFTEEYYFKILPQDYVKGTAG